MNNPLEAVTQAVNSLVTALKLPDESAKANEVLGEMSFPQFSRLLPYRDYNQESGLFMNDTTMGFMLEAIPINGANESIVEALDHMLRTKLPRGIPLCIHLMSSLNRPGFPGECFICELRLPDHRFRWKHNKLFLLLPEEYGPAFPAIVDCYTSPPT